MKKNFLLLDFLFTGFLSFATLILGIFIGAEAIVWALLALFGIGVYNFISSHFHYFYFSKINAVFIQKIRKQHLQATYLFFLALPIFALFIDKELFSDDYAFPLLIVAAVGFVVWYFYITFKDWQENKKNEY